MSDLQGSSEGHAQHRVQVESDSGSHGQYTVEGEIAQWGSFASGAAQRGGGAKLVARIVIVVMLVGLVAGPLLLIFGD